MTPAVGKLPSHQMQVDLQRSYSRYISIKNLPGDLTGLTKASSQACA